MNNKDVYGISKLLKQRSKALKEEGEARIKASDEARRYLETVEFAEIFLRKVEEAISDPVCCADPDSGRHWVRVKIQGKDGYGCITECFIPKKTMLFLSDAIKEKIEIIGHEYGVHLCGEVEE